MISVYRFYDVESQQYEMVPFASDCPDNTNRLNTHNLSRSGVNPLA